MKRFIKGEDRTQVTLLPACLDDYIEAENPVRVVEVFVDGLDLDALGFVGVDPAATGRPAYHPAVLLKLYIYGYLNRIQSSRRLEREAQRNVEVMWLTRRLMPDFKTIANFRKDNGRAIRNVCRALPVAYHSWREADRSHGFAASPDSNNANDPPQPTQGVGSNLVMDRRTFLRSANRCASGNHS